MLKDLSKTYMFEGYKYLKCKKINSSILQLEKAIVFDDNNWEAMNLLGLCFYTVGRFKEAKSTWFRSISINLEESNKALVYYKSFEEDEFKSLCICYNEALKAANEGQYKKADRILKEENLIKSNIVPFIKLKGLCKIASGDKNLAISLWKQVLEINEEDVGTIKYIANSIDSKGERTRVYNLFRNIFKR